MCPGLNTSFFAPDSNFYALLAEFNSIRYFTSDRRLLKDPCNISGLSLSFQDTKLKIPTISKLPTSELRSLKFLNRHSEKSTIEPKKMTLIERSIKYINFCDRSSEFLHYLDKIVSTSESWKIKKKKNTREQQLL